MKKQPEFAANASLRVFPTQAEETEPVPLTAADILAAAQGRRSLMRRPQVATQPLPRAITTPAGEVDRGALPAPRDLSQLTAADILAISKAPQPWQAGREQDCA